MGISGTVNAQENTDNSVGCERYFSESYVSDGQHYMSLLSGEDVAEFKILFYEKTEYRISACSSTPGVELEYRVYDQERNMLFSSTENGYSPFWNFRFESTMECFIEAKIKGGSPESGMATLLIGFKNID